MAFIDTGPPSNILGLPCRVVPRWSTQITMTKGGEENRNQNWQDPLRKFIFPEGVGDTEDFNDLTEHFLAVGGPLNTWPLRNPFDFASCPLVQANTIPVGVITGLDQEFGVTDGVTSAYQLTKTYSYGTTPITYTRNIYLPVVDLAEGPVPIILMNGELPADAAGGPYTYAISRDVQPAGVVTFSPVPSASLTLTWGGLFDDLVRYESDDSLDNAMHSLLTEGCAPLSFVEVRPC